MSRRLRRTALAAALGLWAGPLVGTAPAGAAEQQCSPGYVPGTEALAADTTEANPAHERMNVAEAHELARGRGVEVAVIDSGIAPVRGLTVTGRATGLAAAEIRSGHGTIVAGLIAGPDGVAPDATVYDVKVFDAEDIDTSEGRRVTSTGIAAGLRHVLAVLPQRRIDIVNISLAVREPDPALEAAVAELVARDVIVVAAAGNREEQQEGFEGTPDSDAEVYPADYPGVVAVSAAAPGGQSPAESVLPNLDTDVAAPTLGAVSINATDRRCVVGEVATSWAAAEVSGVLALLRQRFPDETPQQLVARLRATTEGTGARTSPARNPWTGAGVVQAHDALTRELEVGRRGALELSEEEVGADAQAPPPPPALDLFGTSRALLLWTGLLAGALLGLAFLLRPLLRR